MRTLVSRRYSALLQRSGLTMVELMVTLAIAAILLAIAVPSMTELIARKRVEGVANELVSDLRYLQSVTMQRSVITKVKFNAAGTCYSLYVAGGGLEDCDCTQPAGVLRCPQSYMPRLEELKTVTLPPGSSITLSTNRSVLALLGGSGTPMNGQSLNVSVLRGGTNQVCIYTTPAGRPLTRPMSGGANATATCPPSS